MPLRVKDILFLLFRDLTSTCRAESPHEITRIFLTGYPPILDKIYVYESYLPTIKIPPNFKKAKSERFQSMENQPTETSFFFGGLSYLLLYKNRADKP